MLKIRSRYILKNILLFLKTKKYLSLIKYNKEIQKKVDKSLKDYKEYNQIELEIVPIKDNFSGDVINFSEWNKEYYHIYFDNIIKEENHISSKDDVSKIKIIIDYEIKSLERLFENCYYISSINFVKFNRKDITNMSHMFNECKNLININFSNFNTSKVTDMSLMFCNCSSLKELNISNFNTSKVTDMGYMFENCMNLEELNLSSFNTSKVDSMRCMFKNCSALIELKLSSFITSEVTDMHKM